MKKLFIGAAALALIATSCSKNESVGVADQGQSNNPAFIGFDSSTGTRAEDANLATLEGLADGFQVYAYEKNTDGKPTLFRFAAKYKKNGSAWEWNKTGADVASGSIDDAILWPTATDNYPMQFVATYELGGDAALAKDNLVFKPTIAATADLQKDFMYALSKEVVSKPITGREPLSFKHILSKILFKVEAGTGYKVHIQSIKIVNVADQTATEGGVTPAFDLRTQLWTPGITTAAQQSKAYIYKNAANEAGILSFTGATPSVGAAVTGDSGSLMLLPQTTTAWDLAAFKTAANAVDLGAGDDTSKVEAWALAIAFDPLAAALKGARIEVIYRMTDAAGKDVIGWTKDALDKDGNAIAAAVDQNCYVRVGYSLDLAATAWASGKQYTYTIKLGTPDASNGTLIDPEFKGDDSTGTGDIVNNPADVKPGNPITENSTIGFDVDVDAWGDVAGEIK